jgi:hypothetical protein
MLNSKSLFYFSLDLILLMIIKFILQQSAQLPCRIAILCTQWVNAEAVRMSLPVYQKFRINQPGKDFGFSRIS